MLQVDFANKLIGGGVLGHGCVQEEIRFAINPECVVSRLFCQELKSNESIIIKGAERYSNYSGYSKTFQWTGDHVDNTSRDSLNRLNTEIVAIDAIKFNNPLSQFSSEAILRELNKAYAGFYKANSSAPSDNTPVTRDHRGCATSEGDIHVTRDHRGCATSLDDTPTSSGNIPVATGHWGCGAFRGDKQLKSLIQLMAASHSNRSVRYFTFGDRNFQQQLESLYTILIKQKITIGKMMNLFIEYSELLNKEEYAVEDPPSLFEFILETLSREAYPHQDRREERERDDEDEEKTDPFSGDEST
eukprot:TRINITY_DN2234_c0_g1_i3.p1 TRINITY_DN2234_c0_g1~~TRINITY_DN2234_c0_g1_i3.p1  ORF type:complete len:302 (+),score=44.16 TRINITY_DN2234_c0_g1_i3:90-995(+)